MIEIFFDVETKKIFEEVKDRDPNLLGVSIISVFRREINNGGKEVIGSIQSFWEHELKNAWRIFEEADRIIGFNSIRFDVEALKPYFPQKFSKFNHFDILEKVRRIIGRKISLNVLAHGTLGRKKTADGLDAVAYWNLGDKESLEKLKKYCESDVLITRDLYDFGLKNGYLNYTDPWNNKRKVEIDFSYPKEELSSHKQVGLF